MCTDEDLYVKCICDVQDCWERQWIDKFDTYGSEIFFFTYNSSFFIEQSICCLKFMSSSLNKLSALMSLKEQNTDFYTF